LLLLCLIWLLVRVGISNGTRMVIVLLLGNMIFPFHCTFSLFIYLILVLCFLLWFFLLLIKLILILLMMYLDDTDRYVGYSMNLKKMRPESLRKMWNVIFLQKVMFVLFWCLRKYNLVLLMVMFWLLLVDVDACLYYGFF
jgi:hypothetical protein